MTSTDLFLHISGAHICKEKSKSTKTCSELNDKCFELCGPYIKVGKACQCQGFIWQLWPCYVAG